MLKPRLGLWFGIAIAVLLGCYAATLVISRPHVTGDALTYTRFFDAVNNGQIHSATFLDVDNYLVGEYIRRDGTSAAYNTPLPSKGIDVEMLLQNLTANHITVGIDPQGFKSIVLLGTYMLPGITLLLLVAYLILSYRQGSGLFAVRSGARRIEPQEGNVTFAVVAGQAAAIAELKEIGDFLAHPERFAAMGATIPKGILLYGPPGCGKTLLARALAAEEGAAFYSISGSDFVEVYVGVGAARVRDLFREARENAPAIVFIDELDSVGRRRSGGAGGASGSHAEQEQALNQILTEMDGFATSEGIMVIAATNRPHVLDPALLRPGRFDRTIGLERPDERGRLEILQVHAGRKRLSGDTDLRKIAQRAVGLNGADLANVMNEAALLAARAALPSISQAQLDEALQRIIEAPSRQRRLAMPDRSFGRAGGSGEDRTRFADLAGMDDAVAELSEFRDYLVNPERFAAMGARIPSGVLLVGPPGCGKTMLARAVAGETNAAFFAVAASEFVEVFAGEGAARVRDLFAEATAMAPSIVFMDEIDALGSNRGDLGGHEHDQTLNQLLVELDGFTSRSGVIIMGATNRVDRLDPALLRPGRFDRRVTIQLPDRAGRRAILELYARGKTVDPAADFEVLARMTQGMSGADLANLMNEAALLATRRGLGTVTREILDEALERALLGVASRGTVMSEEERRWVACHEAGHALVTLALPGAGRVYRVSIVGRGHTLGAAWHHDGAEADAQIHPRSVFIERMAALLAGRAAEELVFGEPASGAMGDLQVVSGMARRMVCEYGMSPALGRRTFSNGTGLNGRACSEETAAAIDVEINRLIDEAYGVAREILSCSGAALQRVVDALLERETLTGAEIAAMAGDAAPPQSVAGSTPLQRYRADGA